MNAIVEELERASDVLMNCMDPGERKRAEERILKFRSLEQPYELCMTILSQSNSQFVLYEAGRSLSHAIVREWDLVFNDFNNEAVEQTKAFQLLSLLLDWAQNRSKQVPAPARLRVLGAVGALVKRAAAAHAQHMVALWQQQQLESSTGRKQDGQGRTLARPPSDPGPACSLLLRLVDHVEALLRACLFQSAGGVAVVNDSQVSHTLLGLCILTGLLDEMSNADDSTVLTLPLETHVFLRSRFENFELVRIFLSLLHLLEGILESWGKFFSVGSLNQEQAEVVFRLVTSLDTITSWDFLPDNLVWFRVTGKRCGPHETTFRPSSTWAPIFAHKAFSSTLLAFIRFHCWVRASDQLGSRTLACLLRLCSMDGPVTGEGGQLTNDDGISGLASSRYLHLLTCMDHVNYWLACQPTTDDFARLETTGQTATTTTIPIDLDRLPRLALADLAAYELPLLSELCQQLVLHMPTVLYPIKTFLLSASGGGSGAALCGRDSFRLEATHHTRVALAVVERFALRLASLLVQCIRVQTDRVDAADEAHQAIQHLFSTWTDLVKFVSPSSNSDLALPLPLTRGEPCVADSDLHLIVALLHRLRGNIAEQQTRLFEAYVMSKLSSVVWPGVGQRNRVDDYEDEHIDVELDETDLVASEESLFAVSLCGMATPQQSTKLLWQLIDERVQRMLVFHRADVELREQNQSLLVELYEDLHWLLLITGHFLVSGPLALDVALQWCSVDFAIPEPILQFDRDTVVDVDAGRQLLLVAINSPTDPNNPWLSTDLPVANVPPAICLLASLFRLLWLQVTLGLGSAQLAEDNFWVMSRVAVAYLCCAAEQQPDRSDSLILRILHPDSTSTGPPQAHTGAGVLDVPTMTNTNVLQVALRTLLSQAHAAFRMWPGEVTLQATVTRLVSLVGQLTPQPAVNLACPAWYSLCIDLLRLSGSDDAEEVEDGVGGRHREAGSSVRSPDTPLVFSGLSTACLMEMTQACVAGSWGVDNHQLTVGDHKWTTAAAAATASTTSSLQSLFETGDSFFLQLLRSLRNRLFRLFERFSLAKHSQVTSGWLVDQLISSVAILRGLARSIDRHPFRNNSLLDLIALLWSSLFNPALDCAANVLVIYWDSCPEVVQSLVLLFTDVAKYCMVYLNELAMGGDHCTVYADFLRLTSTLCQNYAKRNTDRVISGASAEDDRVTEIDLLLVLLKDLLTCELASYAPQPAIGTGSGGGSSAADVVATSLGHLLPLVDQSLLGIPEARDNLFLLLSDVCAVRVSSLASLPERQLRYLGCLLRYGLFGQVPEGGRATVGLSGAASPPENSLVRVCLELLVFLSDFCLEVYHQQTNSSEAQAVASRLVGSLCLDEQLLNQLFALVTQQVPVPAAVETALASAILGLIHMIPTAYLELVHQWLDNCTESGIQARLSSAFRSLAANGDDAGSSCCPASAAHNGGSDPAMRCYAIGLGMQRPRRRERSEFEQRFRAFVAEVRPFACRC